MIMFSIPGHMLQAVVHKYYEVKLLQFSYF